MTSVFTNAATVIRRVVLRNRLSGKREAGVSGRVWRRRDVQK